ncbi:MAG: hypothetical protein KU38_07735, partial [Sulfurovum sp. FS08-3]
LFSYFILFFIWRLEVGLELLIGDPITLVAGVLRYNFIYFAILVTISKLLRYLFLAYFAI